MDANSTIVCHGIELRETESIEDAILWMLKTNGMEYAHACEVFELVKNDPQTIMFKHRWNDPVSLYPRELIISTIDVAKLTALKWIDGNLPNIWYRSLFAE